MTRYEKVKQIIENTRNRDRKICKNKVCACTGCLSSKGVSENEYQLYLQGKL